MSVLLVAHGSPDDRHPAVITTFADQVGVALGSPVLTAFLDHNRPSVAEILGADESHSLLRVVGLFLSDGYHVRVDVPGVLSAARRPVQDCGPLGLGDWLLPALDRSLAAVDRSQTDGGDASGVVLVAAGSSRPEARDEIIELATRWQRRRAAPVRTAFAAGPGPTIDEALGTLDDAGCDARAIVPLMLAPGAMTDRAVAEGDRLGVAVSAPLLGTPERPHTPPELLDRTLALIGLR